MLWKVIVGRAKATLLLDPNAFPNLTKFAKELFYTKSLISFIEEMEEFMKEDILEDDLSLIKTFRDICPEAFPKHLRKGSLRIYRNIHNEWQVRSKGKCERPNSEI